MSNCHRLVVRQALAAYVDKKAKPSRERKASEPWQIDVTLCCVALGDVVGLERWIGRLEEALKSASSPEIGELAKSLRQLLLDWKDFEVHAGAGALLDFAHCLKSSPPEVVGLERITNAKALDRAKSRVPGDPYWALDYARA